MPSRHSGTAEGEYNPYQAPDHVSVSKGSGAASVRVRFGQPLPMVCAFCGQPATARTKMTVTQSEGGTGAGLAAFLLVGFLPALLAAWSSTTRHSVVLPACDEHRGWKTWHGMRIAGLAALPLLALGLVVIWPLFAGRIILLVLATWLAFYAVHRFLGIRIRATDIDYRGCVLLGISSELAAAFQEMYRSETAEVDSFLDNL
jgi:hypothetical protein